MEHYNAIHFNLLTRVDSLAIGALISCITNLEPLRIRNLVQSGTFIAIQRTTGALLILVLCIEPNEPQINNVVFRIFGYSLIGIFFGTIVTSATFASGNSALRRVLRTRFLTFVGTISYGLYVYHWLVYYPLIHSLRLPLFESHPILTRAVLPVVAIGLTFILSLISYYWIELPIQRLKSRFTVAAQ
mgnify:CR=1 FL=1